ncbi:MAG TPA: hypothetical protein VGH87_24335, partial [Polyangiaceae bacterium]
MSGGEDVDVDAKLRVDELARAGDALCVSFSKMRALEGVEIFIAHHEVHVDGHATVAVLVERERADHGVRQILGFEDRDQLHQRLLDFRFAQEEPPAIIDARSKERVFFRRPPSRTPSHRE